MELNMLECLFYRIALCGCRQSEVGRASGKLQLVSTNLSPLGVHSGSFQALFANIKLTWSNLLFKNMPAYFFSLSVTKKVLWRWRQEENSSQPATQPLSDSQTGSDVEEQSSMTQDDQVWHFEILADISKVRLVFRPSRITFILYRQIVDNIRY